MTMKKTAMNQGDKEELLMMLNKMDHFQAVYCSGNHISLVQLVVEGDIDSDCGGQEEVFSIEEDELWGIAGIQY